MTMAKFEINTDQTAIQNFLRETKYVILLAEDGASKVIVL